MRIDLNSFTADILISDDELEARKKELQEKGGYPSPESQSPWQQYFREMVMPFSEGMVLKDATNYQSIARTKGCRATITLIPQLWPDSLKASELN